MQPSTMKQDKNEPTLQSYTLMKYMFSLFSMYMHIFLFVIW